jgi:hypothetical protein
MISPVTSTPGTTRVLQGKDLNYRSNVALRLPVIIMLYLQVWNYPFSQALAFSTLMFYLFGVV